MGNFWNTSAQDLLHVFPRVQATASLRGLAVAEWTPAAIDTELTARGFAGVALPCAASVDEAGQRRYRRLGGGTTPDAGAADVACELVYEHPDGGLVRVFPPGARSYGLGVLGATARKSVLVRPVAPGADYGLDAELAAVDAAGRPQPRSPWSWHGMRAEADPVRTWIAAREMLGAVRMPVAEGPAPDLRRVLGRDLLAGRTIVPDAEREAFRAYFREWATREILDVPMLLVEEPHEMRVYFFGARGVVNPGVRSAALASVTLDHATGNVAVEGHGYDASRAQLVAFVAAVFAEVGFRVVDDATGEDLTPLVAQTGDLFAVAPR